MFGLRSNCDSLTEGDDSGRAVSIMHAEDRFLLHSTGPRNNDKTSQYPTKSGSIALILSG